ncbi:hypothetical protein Pfo_014945, partial [Paulownia fortunei]
IFCWRMNCSPCLLTMLVSGILEWRTKGTRNINPEDTSNKTELIRVLVTFNMCQKFWTRVY